MSLSALRQWLGAFLLLRIGRPAGLLNPPTDNSETSMQDAIIREREAIGYIDPDKPLWGVEQIAAFVGLPINKTYYRLQKGHLPGQKVGKTWTSTPRILRNRLQGGA